MKRAIQFGLFFIMMGFLSSHKLFECSLVHAQEHKTGDKVQVSWKGAWHPARVKSYNEAKKCWNIHYDNYSDSWDECVGKKRIK